MRHHHNPTKSVAGVPVPFSWTVPYSTQDDDYETGTKQMDLSNQLHCFGLAVIYHLDTNLNPCPDLCLRVCNETSTFLRPDHIPSRPATNHQSHITTYGGAFIPMLACLVDQDTAKEDEAVEEEKQPGRAPGMCSRPCQPS